MTKTIQIHHFSDILCIWAYVSQIRIDELEQQFQQQIAIDFNLFPVFGDVHSKMHEQWQSRGGIQAYAEHVKSVAAQFEHIVIHEAVWTNNTPTSSLPAHLFLSAIKAAENKQTLAKNCYKPFKQALQKAFFVEAQDISQHKILMALLEQQSLCRNIVEQSLNSGEAHARLAQDMQKAKQLNVSSSPTLIFNEDRQRLAGNVGYKIIEANVRELLHRPEAMQSWC